MGYYLIEQRIASKVDELSDLTIQYLEKEYSKLTPAGKFEACILTLASIILILDNNKLVHTKDTPTGKIEVLRIVDYLIPLLTTRFDKYKKEYTVIRQNIPSYLLYKNNLDKYLKLGNEQLLHFPPQYFKDTIWASLSHYSSELRRVQEGIDKFLDGKGKMCTPELTFYSLYVHPFFLALVSNSDKSKYCSNFAIYFSPYELTNPNLYSFGDTLNKIIDTLNTHLNNDVHLRTALFKTREIKNSQPQNVNNKSCYIATMVYGDIDHYKVEILRQYRDTTLKYSFLGKTFIRFYYKISPTLVKYLEGIKPVENIFRRIIDIIVDRVR